MPTHQSLELELELGEQPTTADPAQAQDDASPARTPPSSLRGGGGRKVRVRRVRHHHIFPRGRPTCGLRFEGGGASRFPGLVLALRVGRAPAVEDMAEERPRMINWRPRECSRGRGEAVGVDDSRGRSAGRTETRTGPIFRIWKIGHPSADAPRPKERALEPPRMPAWTRKRGIVRAWLWALVGGQGRGRSSGYGKLAILPGTRPDPRKGP